MHVEFFFYYNAYIYISGAMVVIFVFGELWGFTGRRPLTQMCQAWRPQLLPWAGSSNPWLFWVGRSLQEGRDPVLCPCWDESELPVVTLALVRGEGGELWFETIHSLFPGEAIKKWTEDMACFTLCWSTLTSRATLQRILDDDDDDDVHFYQIQNTLLSVAIITIKRKFFFTHTSSATSNNVVE